MSVYRIAANKLRTTCIEDVKVESPTVKTFTFSDKLCAKAKPGQFLMLWIPGVDEIPLSIQDAEVAGKVSVAVKNVGEATRALHGKKLGDNIGLRGPFGNCFSLRNERALFVAGGTGIAPLLFLSRKMAPRAMKPLFVLGAKTKNELLFLSELRRLLDKENVVAVTEDGTCGLAGLCTEPLEKLMDSEKFSAVYACGPEKMILKALELADHRGIPFEASLERLMRCAIGLCGSCVIGRYRVCCDGPVFTGKQLLQVKEELGKFKLDFEGRRVRL